ncbi:MAG TPA: hypothetical protein P5048_04550, partial [Chlamydiales bacterium]|nr:hypothetical protein [Chlamydiales bacterium]
SKSSLRQVAGMLAAHYKLSFDPKKPCMDLLKDQSADVQISGLYAVFQLWDRYFSDQELKEIATDAMKSIHPQVALQGCMIGLRLQDSFALERLQYFLGSSEPFVRRLASAILATSGNYYCEQMHDLMNKHKDPFVRVNLAIGLLGYQKNIASATNHLFSFLDQYDQKIMQSNHPVMGLEFYSSSDVPYVNHIPNYPLAVDRVSRLELLSILCCFEEEKSLKAIENFLKEKKWNLSGYAGAVLLQYGGEPAVTTIKKLLVAKDRDIRLQAALILALIAKDNEVGKVLEEEYFSAQNNEERLMIVEALGQIGHIQFVPFLMQVFQDPYENLRMITASSILQCLSK